MRSDENPKSLPSRDNILPLVIGTLLIFILVVLTMLYQHELYQRELSQVLSETEIESKKMQINSEMMEIARKRTSITAKIINMDDVFEQDELNQQLEALATDFVVARTKLLELPLTELEKETLDAQFSTISLILPTQRKAVELAMFPAEENRREASELLYEVVYPGQEKIIQSLSQLVKLEQYRIAQLTNESRSSQQNIRDAARFFIAFFLLVSILLSSMVIIRIYRIQNELRESYGDLSSMVKKLKSISEYDELTNLYNRRKFNLYLDEEFLRTKRNDSHFALILIDIDSFKSYNDNYGHIKGDQCLFEVASLMKKALPRKTDFIARYGGEEFVVVLPSTELEGAIKVAEHIRRSVADRKIPHDYSNVADHVSISLGVTVFHGDDDLEIRGIIDAADRCLYLAKSNGRNRVESSTISH